MSIIGDQFEKHYLFRRLAYVSIYYLVWNLTIWHTDLVYYMVGQDVDGLKIASIIAALQAPPAMVMAFVTKLYSDSRK